MQTHEIFGSPHPGFFSTNWNAPFTTPFTSKLTRIEQVPFFYLNYYIPSYTKFITNTQKKFMLIPDQDPIIRCPFRSTNEHPLYEKHLVHTLIF